MQHDKDDDNNRVWGHKIVQKGSEVSERGQKGLWQKIDEEGDVGILTRRGPRDLKKTLGVTDKRMIHPELGFDKIGLIMDIPKIAPGCNTLLHRHNCWEVYYILSGKGKIVIEGKEFFVEKGDAVNIPPNAIHQSFNVGEEPYSWVAVVSPPLIAQLDDIPSAVRFGYLTVLEDESVQ